MRTVAAALIAIATLQPAADPALAEVLGRAAAYVADYQLRLAGVVAEEHYRQNVTATSRGGRMSRQFRELKSDLLMVKAGEDEFWLQFRDVFEVDRKPIRDRDERLYKLFVEPSATARTQAESIQAESSRYNIGPVMRTINLPVFALLFFQRSNQPRMEYKVGRAGNVRQFAALAPEPEIWLIEFRETAADTLIKGLNNRDVRSHGRIWVDSRNGRILKTSLVSEDIKLRATIDVTYKAEPGVPLLVPGEMRELYHMLDPQSRIDTRADYSRFRQFTVTTTEKTKQ